MQDRLSIEGLVRAKPPLRRSDVFAVDAETQGKTGDGIHRTVCLSDTECRVMAVARQIGLTRVSELTGLDTVGIPVFSASLPKAEEGNLTINAGKGPTPMAARVSALMECVERHCGERRGRVGVFATYEQARRKAPVLDPIELILSRDHEYDTDTVLEWWPAYDLMNDDVALIPAAAVLQPYRVEPYLFASSSNGLASGNSLPEALLHALYEVIERDAISLAHAGGAVERVDAGSIEDDVCTSLIGKLLAAGLVVHIHQLLCGVGIPVFQVILDDPVRRDRQFVNAGFGCHLSARTALARALCEAAQARAVIISGARDDLPEEIGVGLDYDKHKIWFARWFDDRCGTQRRFASSDAYDNTTIKEDLGTVVGLVRAYGGRQIFVVDLSIDLEELYVARVVVPGMAVSFVESRRQSSRTRAEQ